MTTERCGSAFGDPPRIRLLHCYTYIDGNLYWAQYTCRGRRSLVLIVPSRLWGYRRSDRRLPGRDLAGRLHYQKQETGISSNGLLLSAKGADRVESIMAVCMEMIAIEKSQVMKTHARCTFCSVMNAQCRYKWGKPVSRRVQLANQWSNEQR